MDWVVGVLTSEFLWGTVLGVVLSVLTARAAIYFQARAQAKTVQKFADDLIRNIIDYSESLVEARERSGAIHYDLLALIETEIGIWGRNREHLVLIEDAQTRKRLRDYFSRCAKLLVDTKVALDGFDQSIRLANATGEPDDGSNRQLAYRQLGSANQSCDKLIAHIRGPNVLPKT